MRYLPALSVLALLAASPAHAQTAANLTALEGLAPFSALLTTDAGKAALAGNYQVTGDIQTGTSLQPALQPFAAQQRQALRDAFITLANGTQLADGLGTSLGNAYQKAATYSLGKDAAGKPKPVFTTISPAVTNLLVYSLIVTELDSNAGKYFFANATDKLGPGPAQPVSPAAMALMKDVGGTTDVMGKAYGLPAGAKGADPLGDSRPFQTEKTFLTFTGQDYFGMPASNTDWLSGPAAGSASIGTHLADSPAFPSGHTTYSYTEATLFAIMLPARYPQEIVRAAEYGNSRIVLGAHYAMDVVAGRTVALYDLAQLLAEKPDYLNQDAMGKAKPIADYAAAVSAAKGDLVQALETATGKSIAAAARDDTSRFADPATDEAFYESTLTYGLPVVFPGQAGKAEDVGKLAPEAGHLLTAAFPYLTLAQADEILTATEGPGGGFLDNGSAFGVYSRLDLYKAGLKAQALAPRG
jgi:hypothetical protein